MTDDIDFSAILRPGDTIAIAGGCGEPTTLVRQLVAQAPIIYKRIGRIRVFLFPLFSHLLTAELGEYFDFIGYGAAGDLALLARAECLEIIPSHYSQLPLAMTNTIRPTVLLTTLSRRVEDGSMNLATSKDLIPMIWAGARIVIAEVNSCAPWVEGGKLPPDMMPNLVIECDTPLVELRPAKPDEHAKSIASHVAGLVSDGATLQFGVGALMDTICRALTGHCELGIHSGIIGDAAVDLAEAGALTNSMKPFRRGITVAGSLLGSRRLLDWAHLNPLLELSSIDVTHNLDLLRSMPRLTAINSAVEIDLTGQVNAEVAGGVYVGAVGGQVDFIRAAALSRGGLSILALPSSARGRKVSRIVAQLSGPVTTARSDVDCVVTEHGVARLKGLSLRQRREALLAIADPQHQPYLDTSQ